MSFVLPHPFGLSLSKACPPFLLISEKRQGFDKLSLNGFVCHG